MFFAKRFPIELKVFLVEFTPACGTSKASRVIFLFPIRFEVLPLNAVVTASAQRTIVFVPMSSAERRIVVHVKLPSQKRYAACFTYEAAFVV